MADKRILQGAQLAARSESFDSGNLISLMHHRQREARIDPASVN